jgi:hypothetical protein
MTTFLQTFFPRAHKEEREEFKTGLIAAEANSRSWFGEIQES